MVFPLPFLFDNDTGVLVTLGLIIVSLVAAEMVEGGLFDDETGRAAGPNDVAAIVERLQHGRRLRQQLDENGQIIPRKRRRIAWNHERARQCVESDYWGPQPLFNDRQFERVFRITRCHAERIFLIAGNTDLFFTQRNDALGKPGICPKVKLLSGLKCLCFGISPSAFQDYFQMGETTGWIAMKKVAKIIANDPELCQEFNRDMTLADTMKASALHEDKHGIAGMVGNLDCMHVGWKNCPVAWQGAYQGKEGKPTIVLEAFADYNLFIWHAYFGAPGTNNDINIWDTSPLLQKFLDGDFPDFDFVINGKTFSDLWLTADGIYPELSRFVKTWNEPIGDKSKNYAAWQESVRKGIERAFGVLQRKFHILVRDIELWYTEDIHDIVMACIIMHNMMVTTRVARDEEEDRNWYNFEEEDGDRDLELDPAMEEMERQTAELDLHRRLQEEFYDGPAIRLQLNSTVLAHRMDEVRRLAVERRWNCLYSSTEHKALRQAVAEQLWINRNSAR